MHYIPTQPTRSSEAPILELYPWKRDGNLTDPKRSRASLLGMHMIKERSNPLTALSLVRDKSQFQQLAIMS